MLSTFSCTCWPSICLFWRNVYLDLLLIFWLGCSFFWNWAAWTVYIFWRLIPCMVSDKLSAIIFIFILLYVIFIFLFPILVAPFKNFSLLLVFIQCEYDLPECVFCLLIHFVFFCLIVSEYRRSFFSVCH